MVRTRRTFLGSATAATVAALAGCTTGSQETTTSDGGRTSDVEDATAVVLQVYDHEALGPVLVDSENVPLYMTTADPQPRKKSTCYGECADAWPPLVATAVTPEREVEAEMSRFERESGRRQVQANEWPLYYYTPDEKPGDAKGQGREAFGGRWWVLRPDGTPVRRTPGEETGTTTDGGTRGGTTHSNTTTHSG